MNYWDDFNNDQNQDQNQNQNQNYGQNQDQNYNYGQNQDRNYNYGQNQDQNYNYSQNQNYGYGYKSDFGFQPPAIRQRRTSRSKNSGFVTKKLFAIGLVCCMLATSALTVGGLAVAGAFNKTIIGSNTISATNYTLAKATGTTKSIEEIVAMNENAVVEIQTETLVSDGWFMNYTAPGAGSGIIVDSSGYILTCNHVIKGAQTVNVITKDGTIYPAKVVGGDNTTDVAVLKIEGEGFVAAQYGDSSELTVGDLAVAIGNPLGKLGGTASVGIISSLDRNLVVEGKSMTLMQTDAAINPGNSGGGLFDGEGNLIGLVVAKSSGSDIEGIGFAIPINKAAEIARTLIEEGKISGRPLIGINVVDASTEALAKEYGVDTPGLYVHSISAQEAIDAGFKVKDIIVAVNDDEVTDQDSLTAAIKKYKPGDTVTVTVMRDGKEVEIETTLIEAD